jgi:hypothetical protein
MHHFLQYRWEWHHFLPYSSRWTVPLRWVPRTIWNQLCCSGTPWRRTNSWSFRLPSCGARTTQRGTHPASGPSFHCSFVLYCSKLALSRNNTDRGKSRVLPVVLHFSSMPEVGFYAFLCRFFNLRSFDLSPGFGLLPSVLSHSPLLYVSQHRSLTAIGQKKASFQSLVT